MRSGYHLSRRGFLQAIAAAAGFALASGCLRSTGRAYTPPPTRREVPPIKDELRLIAVGDWGDESSAQFQTNRTQPNVRARCCSCSGVG